MPSVLRLTSSNTIIHQPISESGAKLYGSPLRGKSKGNHDCHGDISDNDSVIRCEDDTNITNIPDATETVDQDVAPPSTSITAITDLSHGSGDYSSFQQAINAASTSEHRISTPRAKRVHCSLKARCPKNFESLEPPKKQGK